MMLERVYRKKNGFLSSIVLLLKLTLSTCFNNVNSWMVHQGALFAHIDLSLKEMLRDDEDMCLQGKGNVSLLSHLLEEKDEV